MGFFGGDKIAKLMDELGAWFSKQWRKLRIFLGLEETTQADLDLEEADLLKELEIAKGKGTKKSRADMTAFTSPEAKKKAIAEIEQEITELRQKGKNLAAGKGATTDTRLKSEITNLESQIDNYENMTQDQQYKINFAYKTTVDDNLKRLRGQLKVKDPNNIRVQSLYTGGKIATGGIATVHPGEEVIEAAEVSRIERALAGQTLNTAAMDRVGLRFGGNVGMGGTPTMIDQSVTNLSNTTITPMVTRGQMLPGESSSIRPRAAL